MELYTFSNLMDLFAYLCRRGLSESEISFLNEVLYDAPGFLIFGSLPVSCYMVNCFKNEIELSDVFQT